MRIGREFHPHLQTKEFVSEDHPRDDHGRFAEAEQNREPLTGHRERWNTTKREGWSGSKRGTDGVYRYADGSSVTQAIQERIMALKPPPAWTDVRLNPDPNAELQLVGKDGKGRRQSIYSAEHAAKATAEKFGRLSEFHEEVPKIQERIRADLANPNLSPKERESAAVLALINRTGFRVGSDSETGAKVKAFGASTLRSEHVTVEGDTLHFHFTGKKGVTIDKTITDPDLAKEIGPRVARGGRLFMTSDDRVRDYLHSRDGEFKVKDFRTWHGTARAKEEIEAMPVPKTQKEFEGAQLAVCRVVASHLGNTPTVAKQSYIDPVVWGRWKPEVAKKGVELSPDDPDTMERLRASMDDLFATTHWRGHIDDWQDHLKETGDAEDEPAWEDTKSAPASVHLVLKADGSIVAEDLEVKAFTEEQHPRDAHGKFTDHGAGYSERGPDLNALADEPNTWNLADLATEIPSQTLYDYHPLGLPTVPLPTEADFKALMCQGSWRCTIEEDALKGWHSSFPHSTPAEVFGFVKKIGLELGSLKVRAQYGEKDGKDVVSGISFECCGHTHKKTGPDWDFNDLVDFRRKFDGQRGTVEHEWMVLGPGIQKGGIAKDLLTQQLAVCEKNGYQKLAVHADMAETGPDKPAGGFCWARAGFATDRFNDNLRLRDYALGRAQKAGLSQEVIDQIRAVPGKGEGGHNKQYAQTLAFMKDRDGKELGFTLLNGSNWFGHINMRNPEQMDVYRQWLGRRRP